MTHEDYIDLFHKAQVNLVAFKPVFHCNEELRHMVEMAVEAEREACAKLIDIPYFGEGGKECAEAIRARGNT